MSNISVQDTFTTTTTASSFTRSSVDFGVDVPTRLIAISFSFHAASSRTITSVTIGGVAATLAVTTIGAGASNGVAVYYATVTGTSGDVVVTFSGTVVSYASVTYRLLVASTTPTTAQTTTTLNPVTQTVSLAVNDLLIEAALINAGTATITDSYNGVDPITTDINQAVIQWRMASHLLSSESASRTIGYSGGGSNGKFYALSKWPGAVASSAYGRRTLSQLGARSGSRQKMAV